MKHSKKKSLTIVLVALTTCFAASCERGIKWDPDFYAGDSQTQSVINEDGLVVHADEPRFDRMMCLTQEKIEELAEILRRARIPKRDLKKLDVKSIRKRIEANRQM